MQYEYGGSLYPTINQRNRSKINSYLYADGLNNDEVISMIFAEATDAFLASDMLKHMPDEYMDQETAECLIGEIRKEFTTNYGRNN